MTTISQAANLAADDGLYPSLPLANFQRLRLESIDPAKNRYRFYELHWQRTLFGEEVLLATWGRIGKVGKRRVLGLAGTPTLAAEIDRLLRRRRQHRYTLIHRE